MTQRTNTVLEPVGEIRDLQKLLRHGGSPTGEEQVPGASEASKVWPFRPRLRPPMALLGVVADDGEVVNWVHVHASKCAVGREEGDVIVPHDLNMSSRHFELNRVAKGAKSTWYVEDLSSSNGTFARVSEHAIEHDQTLMIGGRLYRFDEAPQGASAATADEQSTPAERNITQPLVRPTQSDIERFLPKFVEVTDEGEGKRFVLHGDQQWIGSDPECSLVIDGDPYVDPRHARLYRDDQGRWHIENNDSMNGTWLKIERIPVYKSAEFQAGEQRFIVRIP